MQFLDPVQTNVPITGTFVAEQSTRLGSAAQLQPGILLDAGITGSMGYMHNFLNRPPIAVNFTGTVQMLYTANLAGAAWEGVSGCYVDFTAQWPGDYLVLVTVMWQAWTANWDYQHFTLGWDYGAGTGVYPYEYARQLDANANTNWKRLDTMLFYLRNVPVGQHRVQLYHSPWGTSLDRQFYAPGAISVL